VARPPWGESKRGANGSRKRIRSLSPACSPPALASIQSATVTDGGGDIAAVPDVSIIVVSYNSEAYLERSVGTVIGGSYEVIIVDNASTDGSRELARRHFPSATLLELEDNVGFGAASNEGMRAASGRYFLLMNPDAWPERDAIEELVRFADARPDLGAAGPRLRSPDGSVQQSAFGYPTPLWLGSPAVTSFPRRAVMPRPRSGAIFVVGTALLLRREAVTEVGGFDPRFFMFNEEIDLCWRMLKAGWRVEVCSAAEFIHVGGASTRTVWTTLYREQLRGHMLFLAKHRGMRHAELARRVLLASARFRSILRRDAAGGAFREAAEWLASGDARQLLGDRE
jgi:N-acetylglucosaminyl-diphospho-decaprenol L-rhamnosyltransferase